MSWIKRIGGPSDGASEILGQAMRQSGLGTWLGIDMPQGSFIKQSGKALTDVLKSNGFGFHNEQNKIPNPFAVTNTGAALIQMGSQDPEDDIAATVSGCSKLTRGESCSGCMAYQLNVCGR